MPFGYTLPHQLSRRVTKAKISSPADTEISACCERAVERMVNDRVEVTTAQSDLCGSG